MFNTLKIIKMVALFFILSGFSVASIEQDSGAIYDKLRTESSQLLNMLQGQNDSLATEARVLLDKIGLLRTSASTVVKGKLSQTELFSLWLSYGDLYRKAASKPGFYASEQRRMLVLIKAHMESLIRLNG